jgi:hypothetical protein
MHTNATHGLQPALSATPSSHGLCAQLPPLAEELITAIVAATVATVAGPTVDATALEAASVLDAEASTVELASLELCATLAASLVALALVVVAAWVATAEVVPPAPLPSMRSS